MHVTTWHQCGYLESTFYIYVHTYITSSKWEKNKGIRTNVLAKCMWNTNTQKDLKYRTQNSRKIAEAPSENKTDTGAHTVHTG